MEEIRISGTGRPMEVDERGRPVDAAAVLRRGRLIVGTRLREERALDRAAGRKPRALCLEELRCLQEAEAAEIAAG